MADTKTTGLAAFTPTTDDLLYGVNDPGGTPVSGRFAVSDVLSLINIADDATPQLGGTLDGQGNQIGNYLNKVVTGVSGTLTAAAHGGNVLITSGNITVPTAAGFSCVLIAGGTHSVSFNSTTAAAMSAGDLMTVAVESATVIHAVLTPAADKVTFS